MNPPNFLLLPAVFLCTLLPLRSGAEESSQVLFSPSTPEWETMIFPNGSQPDANFATGKEGVTVTIEANGSSRYPGVRIAPKEGWDAANHGHIEALVKNNSEKPMRISLRVDDAAKETASGSALIQPGETRAVSVNLDYDGKSKLAASAIRQVFVFGTKAATPQSFVIESIAAAGPAGEKPPVDPAKLAIKPPQGVLLGKGVTLDPAKQLAAIGPAKASDENGILQVSLPGGADEGITLKPAVGLWNLNEYFQVRVHVQNTGSNPLTPSVRVESKEGPTATVSSTAPLAPGQNADIVVPFAAQTPWEGVDDPDMGNATIKKNFKGQPDTGTKFASHQVTGVTVLGGQASGALAVTSINAENPSATDLPAWLGQRPPVDGEWTKTFEDNFDGNQIDLTKWNIYGPNFWDKRTHFSKDNVIVGDGVLKLRVERKTGHHNDSPDGKETDYATGFADTYGKWVQRYGYFEARLKLPTAPCLWPAFWLMPDRGADKGDQGRRQSTKFGGMEFDIVEQLSIWGPQRFNFAMHWDGYDAVHKATGSGGIYVPADKDGFIVVGLLWTPGEAVLYGNGKEIARWKNPRVSDIPSALLLDHVTGGWETERLDDAQLPNDFVVDYVRVWQRKDLASAEDGAKPGSKSPASAR